MKIHARMRTKCGFCQSETLHVLTHEDDHLRTYTCTRCGMWMRISAESAYGTEAGHHWYCPDCDTIVDPVDVTSDETHDVRHGGCGGPVVTIDLPNKTHLIEAAPDMLRALKVARAAMMYSAPERVLHPAERKALDLIDAALRKAQGEVAR